MKKRAIVIVLDSVGIGALPDAEEFGDVGADTLGNISAARGGLKLPNLYRLGLANIVGSRLPGAVEHPEGAYGKCAEVTKAKDTTCGHWEIAGLPLDAPFRTYPRQLLEAMDWITDQCADPKSEYYHLVDLDKVAAMGQSCGGAQVLAVAHDPRIKTCMIFNSGMGEMAMSGASKESLANLHTPMLYINGGTADVAYENANGDYKRIKELPVVKISTLDGHHGTYYEKHAGSFAVVARMWLNWQLKGKLGDSALFLNDEYGKALYPEWTFDRKNW